LPVLLVATLLGGCASPAAQSPSPTTVVAAVAAPAIALVTTSTSRSQPTTTTTVAVPLHYVFPFVGKKITYAHKHHDYPAVDVFGCGASVVAPISGTVDQARTVDEWNPKTDEPATRGGKYVSLIGDDGVRYYFGHLDSVDVKPGGAVAAGDLLGVMGQTGNARKSACHTHVGISWPCDHDEWAVRRGEVWPWKYLDAWRAGEQLSPADEVAAALKKHPDACNVAGLAAGASDA
jgi:peptidoglycan LD-endopeptidase LytH